MFDIFISSLVVFVETPLGKGIPSTRMDFNGEISSDSTDSKEQKDKLPDGEVITVEAEMFKATECLFNPQSIEKAELRTMGIEYVLNESINNTLSERHQRSLYRNVILCGGSTMFRGLPERLKKELSGLAGDEKEINVVAELGRDNSVWIGGSILSFQNNFMDKWITKYEYDDSGPRIMGLYTPSLIP